MRSPAELDDVRWHELTHAYGSAEDVPELIRALYEGGETAGEAIYELFGNIHHQGSVYPASAPSVPFLAHAVLHAPGKRDELLMLLAVLADHDPEDVVSPHWSGSAVAGICAELCRVLPGLLPCLDDPERGVRRAALRVVAAVAELLPDGARAAAVARTEALYDGDPVPAVRADAMITLARFGGEALPLDDALPEVRLAAAVLTAERSGPPYAPGPVAVLARDGADPDPGDDDYPWSGTLTLEERLHRLLTEDPDAGLAVAGHWIAEGDVGSRGFWLAREIVETWRDREAEVLALLAAGLAHRHDAEGLVPRLRTIGRWITGVPEPDAGLLDTLRRHAGDGDEGVAKAALTALLAVRDPWALEAAAGHGDAYVLRTAARSFPEAGDLLIPAVRRALAAGATGNEAIALVGALEPFGAAALPAEPELVDCLRTRRAAIVAARLLGTLGARAPEVGTLLDKALESGDGSLRAAAAEARYLLTGDAGPTLRTVEGLLAGRGPTHWYLGALRPLGPAAAPLLPAVEALLTAGYEWTRASAAEAHHGITGSPERAVSVLSELVGPTPVGLHALETLAAIGRVPDELRPVLRHLAHSPRRLLGDVPQAGPHHPDEQLRTLARRLLATT
ncbi:hypothetical protein AB0F77_16280 [Streptomyces sp. NPDC026672]|uniref:hypothetical protein n=1 Tax=unclassified Streptomyces TaxID=2593676 RepID=UPI0033CA1301